MKKGCCKAKASAVSKNVLETMFCAYRVHRIRKNIFVISKIHRNSWEKSYTKSPTAQSDKLFLQNQCVNAIHPIDYRTCVQLYMGLLRTRGRHMLNGFQRPDPIFTRPEIPQLLPWLQPRWNDSQPGTTTGGNDQMMSGS